MTPAAALTAIATAMELLRIAVEAVREAQQAGRDLSPEEIKSIDALNTQAHEDFQAELKRRQNEG